MKILTIAQLIIAVSLIAIILLQNRGGGMSGIFGGSGGSNVYMTRRGVEKKIFTATIVLAVLFLAISLLNVVI
jgi:protein translocase SecG subunit